MKKLIITLCAMLLYFMNTLAYSQVTADYDKTVDFSRYKTYSFAGWQENSDQLLNDLDKARLQNAFKEEFSKRNMSLVEGPSDAIVTLYIVIDNKTSTTAYTNYIGGMGYGRAGWGWGMGMGSSTTSYSENDYKVGTLVIDVYDGSTKKLVWEGVSQNTIQENPQKREKTIPKKAAKLMQKYPVKPVK
jgi:hypothetical protein